MVDGCFKLSILLYLIHRTPGVKEYGLNMLKLSFVNPEVEDSGSYKCTALYSNTNTLEEVVQLNFYGK